jgi:hypothetical protein
MFKRRQKGIILKDQALMYYISLIIQVGILLMDKDGKVKIMIKVLRGGL